MDRFKKHVYNIFVFVLIIFLIYSSFHNYLLYHSIVEIFSIIIAFSIFIIVINSYDIYKNDYFTFIGVAFAFVAGFDLLHTLAYKGMGVFSDSTPNLATQLWIAARFIESISLLCSFWFLKRSIKFFNVFLCYSVISVVLLLSIFYWGIFPDCYVAGQGLTGFKVASEYLISLLLFGVIVMLIRNKQHFAQQIFNYLIFSVTATILAELAFTIYIDVYGILNLTGHLFKLFSFVFIYKAISQTSLKNPYALMFFKLDKTNKELTRKTKALKAANIKLKQDEKALQQSEAFTRGVLDSIPANIAVLDKQGNVIAVNESWEKFGRENGLKKSLIGVNYLEVCRQSAKRGLESSRKSFEGIKRVIEGKANQFTLEYPCHSPDKKRWFLLYVTPLKSGDGGAVVTHLDITERRKAEQELHKLYQAVEQSSSIIVITDVEGNIEYVNPKFTEITGYLPQEVIGKNPRVLQSGFHSKTFYEELWNTISSGKEWRGEFRNKKKDGQIYWELASISPIKNKKGSITNYIAVKEDITQRKKFEQELKAAKEAAESAEKIKSEFLAKMSHEIRTPLNGIIGMTDLVLSTDLEPRQIEYLEMVKSSADLLLNLINDVLDFSKIEAGKLELENTPFNLMELVENTAVSHAVNAHNKGLELICFVDPHLPQSFYGDPNRIQQVLNNLVGNAVKFTHKGEVIIGVKLVQKRQNRAELRFWVKDTGIGIPEDKMDGLFQRFYQVDSTTTKKYGGTGLGLAISKQLVELMGGEIGVNSIQGKGSVFHFNLYLKIHEDADRFKLKSPVDVLIIDRNKSNGIYLKQIMQTWGATVDIAYSREKALKQIQSKKYDLVVVNVMSNNCITAYHHIKNLSSVSVVMLLNSNSEKKFAQCKTLQKAKCMVKPVRQKELFRLLNTLHADKASRTPAGKEIHKTQAEGVSPDEIKDLKILVAEDNEINKKLAVALLEKKGWQVITAGSGREVLELLDRGEFDLILMDVQMPEMSGYETTAIIREREKQTGSHIPIIAITAYAMKGDKEKCLNAGMDDYVSKPIRAEELYDKISRHVSDNQKGQNESHIDLSFLMENLGNRPEILHKMIDLLLESYPKQLDDIEAAIKNNDAKGLEHAAHKFKGGISNYGASKAIELALELEKRGREGRLDQAHEVFLKLKKEMEKVKKQIEDKPWENENTSMNQ